MPDFTRRGFLFLCGAAAPGLWLAQVGLIQLPGRMVALLGGSCSFCGREAHRVRRLAGVVGRPTRICDECVGLCIDIIAEECDGWPRRGPWSPPADVDELRALLQRVREMRAAELAQARTLLDGAARPIRQFCCSFCDSPRRSVAKLISGPRVFICDGCVGEAAALSANVVLRG